MNQPPKASDAIVIDEIGIEMGRYQDFILKTAYQPIFRPAGGFLRLFAFEGFVMPFRDGKRVPVAELFRKWRPGQEVFVERMCRLLHLRNYRNIGVDDPKLLFRVDPALEGDLDAVLAEIGTMAASPLEIGLSPRNLICAIAETADQNPAVLAGAVKTIRRGNMALAIDDFGITDATAGHIEKLRPDVVTIGGKWFRQLTGAPETTRLFGPLIGGLQSMGASVLVAGIETPEQLAICIDAGVDYLQGHFLAAPQLAGTVVDERPRPFAPLLRYDHAALASEGNVVRLFRR